MRVAYIISRIFTVIFGIGTALAMLTGSDIEFWAGLLALIITFSINTYFGEKLKMKAGVGSGSQVHHSVLSLKPIKQKPFWNKDYKFSITSTGIHFVLLAVFSFGIVFAFKPFLGEEKSVEAEKQQGNAVDLKRRFTELSELENQRSFDKIYDEYISSEMKTRFTKESYIEWAKQYFKEKNILHSSVNVNDAKVDGDIGYIDRVRVDCSDPDCSVSHTSRDYKKFIFIENNWYLSANEEPIVCIRKTGHDIPEEFQRSLSLIKQRFDQANEERADIWSSFIKRVENCLNIQYAKPADDFDEDAVEGLFTFYPSQSMERFDILISPKYSVKDDLLTAILLVHEISHVRDFVNDQKDGEPTGCFETEGIAFSAQNYFASLLNEEEVNSINARVRTNLSREAQQVVDVFTVVPKYPGDNYYEKSLNFVKASPFYKEHCKQR